MENAKDHRGVWRDGSINIQQNEKTSLFQVTYVKEVACELTYSEAAWKVGKAILHRAACDGLVAGDD